MKPLELGDIPFKQETVFALGYPVGTSGLNNAY